jgi:hypothetical protein
MCEQIIVNARFEGLSSGNAVRPELASRVPRVIENPAE